MRYFLLIIFMLSGLCSTGQNFPVSNIIIKLPANPSAQTNEWAGSLPPFTIIAQAKLVNGKILPEVAESRVRVQVKKGEQKICGAYTLSAFNSAVKTWTGAVATALLGGDCTLQPGEYQLCVQFFTAPTAATSGAAPPLALSNEVCKTFTIKGKSDQLYAAPGNIMPADSKAYAASEMKAPLTFRWTPVVPKPEGNITYRLRVWQLMQGQNASQAMKSNEPVITKEVDDITQAVITNLYTGPCKLPYLCEFVWNVEAIGRATKFGGEQKNYGTSEATMFSIQSPCSPDYEFVKDSVYCGADGKVHVKGHIKITPKPAITINQIALTEIRETNYSGATVQTDILVFPKMLTASGNNYFFDFIINSNMCNKNLYIGYSIKFTCSTTGQTTTLPCGDVIENIPCCNCTFCDPYKEWKTEKESVTATVSSPSLVNLQTIFSSPAVSIISFKAELVSMIHNGNDNCFGCNKDQQTFGNFTGGTFGNWSNGVFPLDGTNTTHHTLTWFGANGSPISLAGTSLNISFTVPPFSPLKCCNDEIQFCIRFSFTDKECRTCSFVKCYTVIRTH